MRSWRHRVVVFLVAAPLLAAGCADAPTATRPADVKAMQARWTAGGIRNYRYEFEQAGFLNPCPTPVMVYVQADTADSAVAIATGETLTPTLRRECAPAIDALFADASAFQPK